MGRENNSITFTSNNLRRTAIFCLQAGIGIVSIVFLIWVHLKGEHMVVAFQKGTFYIVYLVFFIWIVVLIRYLQHSNFHFNAALKNNGGGIILSAFMVGIIFLSVPPEFRVLNDDINRVSTSLSMLHSHGVSIINEAVREGGYLKVLNESVLVQPFLFPFLIHLVHLVMGYKAGNVFVLNALLLFCFFVMIYAFLRRRIGSRLALSSIVLIAAQPVFVLSATSGGYELLNILILTIVFTILILFLSNPSQRLFQLLWISMILLAQTRPEALMYFVITVSMLVILRHVKIAYLKPWSFYFVTFLMLLPLIWQKLITKHEMEIVNALLKPDHVAVSSVGHFISNSFDVIKASWNHIFMTPTAGLVNLAGILAIVLYAYLFFMRWLRKIKIEKKQRDLVLISALNISAYWVLIASTMRGNFGLPYTYRFLAFPAVVLTIMAVLFLGRYIKNSRGQMLCVVIAFALFVFYHPVSIGKQVQKSYSTKSIYDVTISFLEDFSDKNILVVTNRPRNRQFPKPKQFVINDIDAITLRRFNRTKILRRFDRTKEDYVRSLKENPYDEIFIIEYSNRNTKQPLKYGKVDPGVKSELVLKRQIGSYLLRIYKVLKVKK